MNTLIELQSWIYAYISRILSDFAVSGSVTAIAWILILGAAFGSIHAMTPGHGKAILASYITGSNHRILHGTSVAIILAATHIVSAVLIAVTAAPLITKTLAGAGRAPLVENLSRGLLVVFGAWFLVRAWRGVHRGHSREGFWVGFTAGLVPCPLTLFVMFYSLSRGIPAAGLTFSLAMFVAVAATLASGCGTHSSVLRGID